MTRPVPFLPGGRPCCRSKTEVLIEKQFKEVVADVKREDGIDKTKLRDALRKAGICCARFKAWRAVKGFDLNKNGKIDGDEEMKALIDYAHKNWGIIINKD